MAKYAIIGGTGFEEWLGLKINRQETVNTPYRYVQFPITYGMLVDIPVIFLSRHGPAHITPPHQVNYRANIWALKEAGVTHVVAINAVGGITVDAHPGAILIPDQVIDYTWGRSHTFYEVESNELVHTDFTYPYDTCLRAQLLAVGRRVNIPLIANGTYGACQGPRFETAAEINRLEKDGCNVVGMTGMPEASLAREVSLAYAACCMVVNWAAGRGGKVISMEDITVVLKESAEKVRFLLSEFLQELHR